MNNAYFDGQVRNCLATQEDDKLIDRMKEIKGVADAFNTGAWQVLIKDAGMWKQQMDDRWQDVSDEKILINMRIVKQAFNFIQSIPEKYQREVELLEEELQSRELKRDITEE
jgi:hypothetical protein